MWFKKIVKAVLWFASAPLARYRFLSRSSIRMNASGFHRSAVLTGNGHFHLSSELVVGRRSRLHVQDAGRLSLGPLVWIGNDCELSAEKSISIGGSTSLQNRSIVIGEVAIGAGCVCAPNLYVSSAWHHFDDDAALPIRWQDARASIDRTGPGGSRPVHIGEDCWIGVNVVITPGVSIGRGCVIGANSVVTKNVPPYCVAVGAPARVIRQRLIFSPPMAIDAGDRGHIPYFYSGFDMWQSGVAQPENALLQGGWPAAGQFALALTVAAGSSLVLTVHSEAAGELTHASCTVPILKGASQVRFAAKPSDQGLLLFSWTCTAGAGAARIAIIAAAYTTD